MKKSELISGIILTLAGVAALIAALLTETSFDGIFWGIAGAGLCLGVGRVISWFHWSSPAQADRLKELQENKEIAQHDELNRIIMDRAGRIAYNFSLLLIVCTHTHNHKSAILLIFKLVIVHFQDYFFPGNSTRV